MDLAAEFSLAGEEEHLHATLSGRQGVRPADFMADLSPLSAELELARQRAGFSGSGRLRLRRREIARLKGTPERLQIELLSVAGSELADLLPPARRPALLAGATGIGGTVTADRRSGRPMERPGAVAGGIRIPAPRQAAATSVGRPGRVERARV